MSVDSCSFVLLWDECNRINNTTESNLSSGHFIVGNPVSGNWVTQLHWALKLTQKWHIYFPRQRDSEKPQKWNKMCGYKERMTLMPIWILVSGSQINPSVLEILWSPFHTVTQIFKAIRYPAKLVSQARPSHRMCGCSPCLWFTHKSLATNKVSLLRDFVWLMDEWGLKSHRQKVWF